MGKKFSDGALSGSIFKVKKNIVVSSINNITFFNRHVVQTPAKTLLQKSIGHLDLKYYYHNYIQIVDLVVVLTFVVPI